MTRYKMLNGERIAYTAEEEKARDAKEKAWADGEADRGLAELRRQRNILLVETDWMANSDVTMSNSMKTYRQQLRDVTNGLDTLDKIKEKIKKDDDGNYLNLPTKPTE